MANIRYEHTTHDVYSFNSLALVLSSSRPTSGWWYILFMCLSVVVLFTIGAMIVLSLLTLYLNTAGSGATTDKTNNSMKRLPLSLFLLYQFHLFLGTDLFSIDFATDYLSGGEREIIGLDYASKQVSCMRFSYKGSDIVVSIL